MKRVFARLGAAARMPRVPTSAAAWSAALIHLFPEREFFMRSEGHVRFIRISTRVQAAAAGGLAAIVIGWVGILVWALLGQITAGSDQHSLLEREAAVATAENRLARYRANLGTVAADLERRQDLLEKAVQGSIGPLPDSLPQGTVSDSTSETNRTMRKISQVMPEASGLAHVEARQIALAERLTRYADDRATAAADAIRKVGLNPTTVVRADARAQGGPLIRLADMRSGTDGLDPRFLRLVASLARMNAMHAGVDHIPNTLPASLDYISSGFGVRSDPIDGGAAFHPGLDFKGPIGAPIFAAAVGTVSFTGVRQGYGNCVEITHGAGLVTRYAHMSRILAHMGQQVVAGTQIGAIGSTGRSTGPHLHFEVRINDRPVNPRPFLEAMPHVFQEARAGNGIVPSGSANRLHG
ncbi:peptidase M23B [Novosphingobium nitrogenifigens DSM 19370]|uniref:Peptidase M23B n=1 Tax=Novosphingobium nitrogenifigens DSM 19370 TaxID=983920 RepID=F1Z5X6_9SPHN|nr:M23 family metallopeptidase [Novosphingobium nitrogenifigens]EGD60236.1 peptidase M23B [Novosphingobium nitrogenifigens DSM 19370]